MCHAEWVSRFTSFLMGLVSGQTKVRLFWVVLGIFVVSSAYTTYHLLKTGFSLVGKLPEFSRNLVDEVYPAELEISIVDGIMTSNVVEPYHVKIKVARLREVLEMFYPQGAKNLPNKSEIRLLTINGNATQDQFDNYQTMALLTRDKIYYQGADEVGVINISADRNYLINKENVNKVLENLLQNNYVNFFMQFGAFIVLGFYLVFSYLGLWFEILAVGLLIYFMGRLLIVVDWTFEKAVKMVVVIFFSFRLFTALQGFLNLNSLFLSIFSSLWTFVGLIICYGLFKKAKGEYAKTK